jgi:hypothetical protein
MIGLRKKEAIKWKIMDREEIIIAIFSYLGLIFILLACYFLAIKITAKKHFKGLRKHFLRLFLASIICFSLCLAYTVVGGLLANIFDFNVYPIGIRILDGLSVMLFPISILLTLVFAFCFLLTKNKEPRDTNQNVTKKL